MQKSYLKLHLTKNRLMIIYVLIQGRTTLIIISIRIVMGKLIKVVAFNLKLIIPKIDKCFKTHLTLKQQKLQIAIFQIILSIIIDHLIPIILIFQPILKTLIQLLIRSTILIFPKTLIKLMFKITLMLIINYSLTIYKIFKLIMPCNL